MVTLKAPRDLRGMVLVRVGGDLWVPQQRRSMVLVPVGGDLCQLLTDNLLTVNDIQICTKVHYACHKQCHVCLGSHLTKPCLSCVVTSKTAAC